MAKEYAKLAGRYARALLRAVERELGSAGSPTPAQHVARSLSEFGDLWSERHELSDSIINPMFDKRERLAALLKVAELAELPELARRFLSVVFERDRIAALPEIAAAFSDAADKAAGVVQVAVVSARPVDAEEVRSIEASLAQQISGRLEFQWSVDPALLGGLVVKFQGKVLDGSLSGRLERIERKLMSGAV
ncbi:MAG: ATP synthase F1 subunit delta [Bdellovibrionales bacterium]|nr:ATP synthase F1 subunit delta [Bdellovibrionales bacterium]